MQGSLVGGKSIFLGMEELSQLSDTLIGRGQVLWQLGVNLHGYVRAACTAIPDASRSFRQQPFIPSRNCLPGSTVGLTSHLGMVLGVPWENKGTHFQQPGGMWKGLSYELLMANISQYFLN